ncbi:MAG: hypothetical protein R2800_08610 [Flavipsychrobacter sp.]
MKQIILSILAVVAMSFATKAQVQNLTIQNNTGCTVAYLLTSMSNPNCTGSVSNSSILTVAPGGTVNHTSGNYYIIVDIYNIPPCSGSTYSRVGEVYECGGTTQYNSSGALLDAVNCNACGTVNINWTSTGPNSAIVSIN